MHGAMLPARLAAQLMGVGMDVWLHLPIATEWITRTRSMRLGSRHSARSYLHHISYNVQFHKGMCVEAGMLRCHRARVEAS